MFSFIKKIFKGTLHKACQEGNIKAVKQFLAEGADVNARDKEGYTPLHDAALRGRKEIAELLIAKGADVNGKNDYGETPMHYAADCGHREIIELLIAKGANVNAHRTGGSTPLDMAEEVDEIDSPEGKAVIKETADLLRKHGGKTKNELEAAGN